MARERLAPEVRKAEILDAAAALFVARGVDRVAMADVAEAAGVAKGLLYHYFSSKDELLGVLRDRYMSEWYEEIDALLSDPAPGDELRRLERFMHSMYEFHADKVELHHLLFAGEGSEDEVIEKVRKLLLAFVRAGVASGSFECAKPEVAVDFVLHGLHGLLVTYLHAGRSSRRFTRDAMTVIGPVVGA